MTTQEPVLAFTHRALQSQCTADFEIAQRLSTVMVFQFIISFLAVKVHAFLGAGNRGPIHIIL